MRRSKQRRELRDQLSTAVRKLSRSRPYQASSHEFQELTNLLLRSGEEEKRRLDEALDRILRIAEVIPIGLSTIRSAIALQRSRSLSPQDSIVYASILAHLTETTEDLRCFITKNSKDFVNPDIENDLATHTCRLLTKFGDGLGYIRSRL